MPRPFATLGDQLKSSGLTTKVETSRLRPYFTGRRPSSTTHPSSSRLSKALVLLGRRSPRFSATSGEVTRSRRSGLSNSQAIPLTVSLQNSAPAKTDSSQWWSSPSITAPDGLLLDMTRVRMRPRRTTAHSACPVTGSIGRPPSSRLPPRCTTRTTKGYGGYNNKQTFTSPSWEDAAGHVHTDALGLTPNNVSGANDTQYPQLPIESWLKMTLGPGTGFSLYDSACAQ